jgi:3-oxoacyl-[acyl-carrier protein] reductase
MSTSPFSLAGHVALVTGSSKGLGKAMAMALGAAGAKVCINYAHGQAKAEQTFAEFEQRGYEGMLAQADVTDQAAVDRMCAEIKRRLGAVDILVPNATCAQPQMPIEEYDWAFHQAMVDFFIKSPFLLTRACIADMKRKRWGRIINIGSEVFRRGVPCFSAYVAAKGAQEGWTRSMASELAPHNITVNLVAPGWIPVERHENDPPEAKEGYRSLIPMGRWGVPDDVGGAIVFLASNAASFITGQSIAVNGGMTVG